MRSDLKILFVWFLFLSLAKAGEINALHYLNDLRQQCGLITLKSNHALQKAAKAHANYLLKQQTNTHYEKKGYKGFSGKTPSDRVVRYGYASRDVMENISVNTSNAKVSIAYLLAAIYHRFVFLNFDKDEIGIGRAVRRRKSVINKAMVYDLGSSKLNHLCQKKFILQNGTMYLQNVCAESQKLVPPSSYQKSKDEIRRQNTKAVCYPYNGQLGVLPAFYNEFPDPLPDYKVSGYPVTVQLNPGYYQDRKIVLSAFRLYDDNGKVLEDTRVITRENDPNRRLKRGQFALMPLKRLEYGMTYTARFDAKVEGESYTKTWSFTTTRFKEKLYRITEKNVELDVKAGSTVILYFVPESGDDLLTHYRPSRGLKVDSIDQNTLRVKLPRKITRHTILKVDGRKVKFY